MRSIVWLPWSLLVLLVPSAVAADVVPDDYVESCTLSAMASQHTGCEECRASFQAPAACSEAHASDGRTQACRSGGASVWTEIWCLPAGAPPPTSSVPAPTTTAPPTTAPPTTAPTTTAPPAEESHSGCAVLPTRGASLAPWGLAFALVLSAGVARRGAARRARRAVARPFRSEIDQGIATATARPRRRASEPSRPPLDSPQQRTVPSPWSAHACSPPHAIAVT